MIHVENLTRHFDEMCAVDHISFDIRKGEILGLLGPNGAGKTTTLRMLTGFLKPTSGTVLIKDYNIDENPLEIKQLMGYLPESAPLYHEMLVYDYLSYVANIRGIEKSDKLSRIKKMVELCGLAGVMHKSIDEISKGYKQRVGLAHAMMNDPEILILDEPTSGLDPNQIVEIRKIIRQIGKEKTIIFSTHILSEAEATCDRIAIINQGKIVADGSTESIKQSADGTSTISISLKNDVEFKDVENLLQPITGINKITQNKNDTDKDVLKLSLTCLSSEDLRGPIYQKIKQTDWTLLELFQEAQSLENIFRKLTREN